MFTERILENQGEVSHTAKDIFVVSIDYPEERQAAVLESSGCTAPNKILHRCAPT